MKISYDKKEDVSYGWNITAGMIEHGLGKITILDVEQDGLLPLEPPESLLKLRT